MYARRSLPLYAATPLLLGVALLLAITAPPAGAVKDVCAEAVSRIYNDCHLVLGTGDQTYSFTEALQMCQEQADQTLKDCWTNCATDIADCGKMVQCIDTCFQGLTACSFLVQFVYDFCDDSFLELETQEALSRAAALEACRNDITGLFACYETCSYQHWEVCQDQHDCNAECLAATDDDDDDDDDDNDDNDSPAPTDHGKPLEDVHGSSCGI